MAKYNHMFDVAFEVISDDAEGEDVTPAMLRAAMLRRIEILDTSGEWLHACGLCDTYEVEEEGDLT